MNLDKLRRIADLKKTKPKVCSVNHETDSDSEERKQLIIKLDEEIHTYIVYINRILPNDYNVDLSRIDRHLSDPKTHIAIPGQVAIITEELKKIFVSVRDNARRGSVNQQSFNPQSFVDFSVSSITSKPSARWHSLVFNIIQNFKQNDDIKSFSHLAYYLRICYLCLKICDKIMNERYYNLIENFSPNYKDDFTMLLGEVIYNLTEFLEVDSQFNSVMIKTDRSTTITDLSTTIIRTKESEAISGIKDELSRLPLVDGDTTYIDNVTSFDNHFHEFYYILAVSILTNKKIQSLLTVNISDKNLLAINESLTKLKELKVKVKNCDNKMNYIKKDLLGGTFEHFMSQLNNEENQTSSDHRRDRSDHRDHRDHHRDDHSSRVYPDYSRAHDRRRGYHGYGRDNDRR